MNFLDKCISQGLYIIVQLAEAYATGFLITRLSVVINRLLFYLLGKLKYSHFYVVRQLAASICVLGKRLGCELLAHVGVKWIVCAFSLALLYIKHVNISVIIKRVYHL